jgi:hypothetical protein
MSSGVCWECGVVQRNVWLIHDVGVLNALGHLLGEAFASEVTHLAAVEAGSLGPLRWFRPSCLGCVASGLVASRGAGAREIHGDWGVVHPARGVGGVVLGAPLLLWVALVSCWKKGRKGRHWPWKCWNALLLLWAPQPWMATMSCLDLVALIARWRI